MSEQGPGTIKYKSHRFHINIGMIICIIIILYFVAYFFDFLVNRSSSFYEVDTGYTSSEFDGQYTALIIRDEKVVSSGSTGFVNYFVGDESPVYVGQQAYMIDTSGELSYRLGQAAQSQAILNENDLSEIKNSLYEFRTSFQDSDYYDTYHFKYQLESQILELVNTSIFENNDIRYAGNVTIYKSDLAGIAMHYIDGFENCTIDSFDASSFRKNAYSKSIIKSNDHVDAGSPVYKVITSEEWYLVIQINNPDAFKDLNVVSIEFLKDNISADANFEVITRGGNYYGVITLNKYMIHYASDRYTQIAFKDDTYSGLKIPESAVTYQTYLAVPSEFLVSGGNSSELGFAVKTMFREDMETVVLKYPQIVKQENNLCYIPISDNTLQIGDVLVDSDSRNEFTIGMTAEIQGVYVNTGDDPVFRFIDILGENNGFYIVSTNSANGIKLFDQVYTNYKDAEKNDSR